MDLRLWGAVWGPKIDTKETRTRDVRIEVLVLGSLGIHGPVLSTSWLKSCCRVASGNTAAEIL